jgi:hypothetical protein
VAVRSFDPAQNGIRRRRDQRGGNYNGLIGKAVRALIWIKVAQRRF